MKREYTPGGCGGGGSRPRDQRRAMGADSGAGKAAVPAVPLFLRRSRRQLRAPLPGLRQPGHRPCPHPRGTVMPVAGL